MNELFGVSMDIIMYVLVALLALALGSVTYVALTNRVMFKLGIRNLPRRRAQTTLIVLGLMLSTVIISAAFTTGDTVDRSITSQVYSVLGSMDEIIQVRAPEENAFEDATLALVMDQPFTQASVNGILANLKLSETFDYVIPAYSAVAVGINEDKKLSAPQFNVVGLDLSSANGLPDIQTKSGQRLALDQLGPNELYLNEAAADELDAEAGDTVTLVVSAQPIKFKIREVVQDRRLAGAGGVSVRREGGVMSLQAAQALFNAPGQLTMIAVSNRGDARGGYKLADRAESELNAALGSNSGNTLAVVDVKKTGVEVAEFGANILTTFFLVFGLFSIGAGVLLIFLIFVMLAAERKPEMGMARAIGTRRIHIVHAFLAEGMAYNVGAAAVGAALGVAVAFAMSKVMSSIFAQIDIDISPHVTPRSLVISYSLGVVLTFLTVTFSSWRVSYINIVRAIRDIPEPSAQRPMWNVYGIWPTLQKLIFKAPFWKQRGISLAIIVLGMVVIGAGGGAGGAATVIASVIGGTIMLYGTFRLFQMGFLFVFVGLVSTYFGASSHSAFLLLFGLSLIPLGVALIARSFGGNERLVFTLVGVLLIYIWEIDFSVGLVEAVFGEADGDIEMFFLSGVMVTVAATFIVVYNADIILGPITALGRYLGGLLPSIKMAVAYPLANRSRTGMTMAMFCLVVFALTVMSSMNHNFNRLYLSDNSLGGFDIDVAELPINPIGDLRGALVASKSPVANQIEAVAPTSLSTRFTAQVCERRPGRECGAPDTYEGYAIWGDSKEFFDNSRIPLQSKGIGYASDEAVWAALASDPSLAVVDSNALAGAGFGAGFIEGIKADEATFEPVVVMMTDLKTGKMGAIKVIGVIQQGASTLFGGMHMSQAAYSDVFAAPDARRYFIRTAPGVDNKQAARDIEAALINSGAQAESLRQQLNEFNAVQSGFFYLLQGFMGLGLFVGVAAVGVIAFRTVVERRQQIGMLRAIGYTRKMIGLTFLMEAAFIAFMGVVSGIFFALILAYQLISQEFANQGVTSFAVPWLQVGVIGAAAFGFALLMTLIPSRQAAGIPIAQALRYE